MKKTKKALLAVLACSAIFAGAFGLAACDGSNGGDGGDGGEPLHTHHYVGTPNNDGTHNATCDETKGTCDAKTVTNQDCDTDGTDGACSVCGYKEVDGGDEIDRTATVNVGEEKTFDSLDETGLTLTLNGAEEGKSYTLSSTNDKVVFQAGISQGNSVTFVYHEKGEGVTVRSTDGTLSDVTIKIDEEEEEKEFTTIAVNEVVTATGVVFGTPKKYEIQLAEGKYQIFVVNDTTEQVTALDATAPFGIGAGYDNDGNLIPLVPMSGDDNTVEVDEGKYYIEAYEDVTFKVATASVHAHVWKWEVTKQPTADETGSATKVECLGTVGTCDWEADGSSVELPTLDSERYFVGEDSASCLTAGTQRYTITIDGEVISFDVETPKLDHTEQELAGKEATCTETGLTAGKKCSICHTVIEEQEVIPAKGHTLSTTATPTVNETAKTVAQRCTTCNKALVYEYDNAVLDADGAQAAKASALSAGVNYVTQSTTNPYLGYEISEAGTYSIYWLGLNNSTFNLSTATFGTTSTAFINSNKQFMKANIPEGLVIEGYSTSDLQYYIDNESVIAKAGEHVRLTKDNLSSSQTFISLASFVPSKLTFTITQAQLDAATDNKISLKFRTVTSSTGGCFLIGINKEPAVVAELSTIGEGNFTVKDSGLEFEPVTEAGTYTFTAENGKFAVYVNGELYSDDAKDYFGYVAFSYRYLTVTLQAGDVVKVVKVGGKASENIVNIKNGAVEEPAAPEYNTLETGNNTITLKDTEISTGKYEDGTENFYTFTVSESGYYEISVADDVTVGATIKVDREHYSTIFDVSATGKHSGVFYAEAGETIVIAFVGNGSLEFAVNIAPGEEPITYLNVDESLNVTFSGFDTIVKLTVGDSVAEGTYTINFAVSTGMLRSNIYFSVNNAIVVEDKYNPNGVNGYINADIAAGANHTVGAGTKSDDDDPLDVKTSKDYTRTVTLKAGDVIYLATDSLTAGYADITLTPVTE